MIELDDIFIEGLYDSSKISVQVFISGLSSHLDFLIDISLLTCGSFSN